MVGLEGAVDRTGTEDDELVSEVTDAEIGSDTVCVENTSGSEGVAVGVKEVG